MVDDASTSRSLAGRLNHAYEMLPKSDGSKYSNDEVSRTLGEQGEQISASYLWQLRTGKKDNPTLRHLEALAKFFGLPVAYFFDDTVTDRVDIQLEELRQERARLAEVGTRDAVKLMALRAGQLAPDRFRLVSELVDVVYRQQQMEQGAANG